jgi:hypothetical protein
LPVSQAAFASGVADFMREEFFTLVIGGVLFLIFSPMDPAVARRKDKV